MSMYNNKFVNICFDSNSQTSKPIRSLKSPTVEQEGTKEEGEQQPTNEDLDTSGKKILPQMFGSILQGRKLMGNLKPKVKTICVII